jgi:monovalent cation/hydrogen antiporter
MQSATIHHLELVILFIMALVIALTALARRFHTPFPIVLVIGGLAVSLFPKVPRIALNPDIVFLVLLPPLLFAAAFHTSWRNFCQSLTKSSMMAFGLVAFSVIAVAFVTGHLLPGFDHRVGFVLGALVASTDAIAATSIAKRMHLPQPIVDVLEGESLLNDATSLLALEFSVAVLVADSSPGFKDGLLRLIFLVAGGVAIGLVSGWIIRWGQQRITDAPLEITLTLIAPYMAYLGAEAAHTSGVLATVACGLILGEKQSRSLSARARLEAVAVWSTVDFVLNGVVFALIGLQLPYVLEGNQNVRRAELLLDASILVVLLIALRLLWVFAVSWIAFALRRLTGRDTELPRSSETFILGWTGMRGVIALAAAMSLPQVVSSGDAFPQRDVLIFLTFCVILVTLVAQGLSLPFLISRFGLAAEQQKS